MTMTVRRYSVWIIVAASAAGAGLWIDHAIKEAKIIKEQTQKAKAQTQKEKDAIAIEAAKQLNEQWEKSFDKTGEYPERQNPAFHSAMLGVVEAIYRRDARVAEAKELQDKMRARQLKIDENEKILRKQRLANDVDGRKRFADNLDTTFLKAGRDAHFRVSGPKSTTLEVTYVLINRPAVYQITNETNFLQDAWSAGFKRVIFRSGLGYGSDAWTYDAPPGLQ